MGWISGSKRWISGVDVQEVVRVVQDFEIKPRMQVELLRVLQERTFRPVGGEDNELTLHARLLTATPPSAWPAASCARTSPLHSEGDAVPCTHPMHPSGDLYPCRHPCMGPFGPVPCHPLGDLMPCTHPAHPGGHREQCRHPMHPQGDTACTPR